MFEHLPEQILGHGGVTMAVGVGKTIATGWSGPANGRERSGMEVEGVADVIEPDGMGELRVQQGDHLTPWAEGPGLFIDPMLASQPGDQVIGDKVAELAEDGEFTPGWLRAVFVFHTCRVAGEDASANLLYPSPMGWL